VRFSDRRAEQDRVGGDFIKAAAAAHTPTQAVIDLLEVSTNGLPLDIFQFSASGLESPRVSASGIGMHCEFGSAAVDATARGSQH
jgi:hypothetical protein